jgi:hypothetical protein
MYLPDILSSLPEARAERWQRLAELIGGWSAPLEPQDGFPEEAIGAAEVRLGLALPAALREAYLLFGRKVRLGSALGTIVPPPLVAVLEGLLVVAVRGDVAWGIAESDLEADDPPVMCRDPRHGVHPVFKGDSSFSGFLVSEVLRFFAMAGRYTNRAVKVPAGTISDVPGVWGRLDIGQVASPTPEARLYGGQRCLVTVLASSRELYLTAPDRESYRAAHAALGGLRWEWTETEARRAEFLVQYERWTAQLATNGDANARMQKAVAEGDRRAARARVTPGRPAPLDPRLAALVARAIVPYEGLLPPAAAAFFVEAAGYALDVYPTLDAWTSAFLGKPQDVARPRPDDAGSFDDFLEELEPEKRAVMEGMIAAGVPERMQAWRAPREGATGARARSSGAESVFLDRSELVTQDFLSRLRARPPTDEAERERELSRIVRQIMASLFAGVVGAVPAVAAAGYARACEPYRRAAEAFACFEGDRTAWDCVYGPGGAGLIVLIGALDVSSREAFERVRAFLDELADTMESSEEVAALRRAGSTSPARSGARGGGHRRS